MQEFLFIPLDIVKKIYENNGIRNKLEAWLIFLVDDNPETIMQLFDTYPEFRKMYEEVCDLCTNTEKVMNMFSKELLELDRNTVQLMIDDMQDTIDNQVEEMQNMQEQHKTEIAEKDAEIAKKDAEIAKMEEKHKAEIAQLMAQLSKKE